MSEQHKVTIKVLRLGRPQMKPASFDQPALYTDELVLPKTIGPCFAGEQFKCLLSIIAEEALSDVQLVAEIHNGKENTEIINETGLDLSPDHSLNRGLECQLDQAGLYSLVIQVKYITDEHLRTLSKTFSFDVATLLQIRVRISSEAIGEASSGCVEVQVENCAESSLTLIKYQFEHENYQFKQNQPLPITLKPKDVFSFASFIQKENISNDIGKAVIEWTREPLGNKGSTCIALKR